MRLKSIFIVIILVALLGSAALADTPTLSEAIDRLEAIADSYPPKVDDSNRKSVLEMWQWAESGMLQYRAGRPGPDENAELLLGEIYRLGHNLDVPGAGEKAISHFRAALAINPANPKTHMLLGRHLTFSNQLAEGEHELLLAVALDPRGAGDLLLFDLAHNAYLRHDFAVAMSFAERYLKMHPDDGAMKLIVDSSRKALAGGPVPKVLTIPQPRR